MIGATAFAAAPVKFAFGVPATEVATVQDRNGVEPFGGVAAVNHWYVTAVGVATHAPDGTAVADGPYAA